MFIRRQLLIIAVTGRSLLSSTTPTHISTSTSWLQTSSRFTKRVSGCLQSTQHRCRPLCHPQFLLVQARSNVATLLWSRVRQRPDSGLSTRALLLSRLRPWILPVTPPLMTWAPPALAAGSMLRRRLLSRHSVYLLSVRRRRLDHTLAQHTASLLLVPLAVLVVVLLALLVVRLETRQRVPSLVRVLLTVSPR